MHKIAPHYLLLTESQYDSNDSKSGGRWRFVLESMQCDDRTEVSERENDVWGERLQLLAVVRGVEALEQPSKLTLITSSPYVGKRIRKGFDSWIQKQWRWESFGLLKPIKDADLWKRIHAAMQIHSIECRLWQFSNRPRMIDPESAEAENWNRFDTAHTGVRKPYGPIEFESGSNKPNPAPVVSRSNAFEDEPRFVPTRTGWTRVTEVDPDTDRPLLFPQAFGGTIN